jgi:hypothetical protein
MIIGNRGMNPLLQPEMNLLPLVTASVSEWKRTDSLTLVVTTRPGRSRLRNVGTTAAADEQLRLVIRHEVKDPA